MLKQIASCSLRWKAIAFVLTVVTMALVVTGAATITRMNALLSTEKHADANTCAQNIALACELPLAVGDAKELKNLTKKYKSRSKE